jgi:serine/threonine protein kinase
VGHPDRSPAAQSVQPESSGHRHRHLNHWRGDAHHASSSQPSSQEKKKQQQEQELRQKEVLRLKQQREREKQQAKQFRLDQFPEYCMVMEFAAGGDLFNLLTKSHPPISLYEKHCLWRQLINGVQYMHSMGVAVSEGAPPPLPLLLVCMFVYRYFFRTTIKRSNIFHGGVCLGPTKNSIAISNRRTF